MNELQCINGKNKKIVYISYLNNLHNLDRMFVFTVLSLSVLS